MQWRVSNCLYKGCGFLASSALLYTFMYSSSVRLLPLTEDLLELTGYGPCRSLTSTHYNSRSSGEHLGATHCFSSSSASVPFLCLHASLPPCLFASVPLHLVPLCHLRLVPLCHHSSCASVLSFILCLCSIILLVPPCLIII